VRGAPCSRSGIPEKPIPLLDSFLKNEIKDTFFNLPLYLIVYRASVGSTGASKKASGSKAALVLVVFSLPFAIIMSNHFSVLNTFKCYFPPRGGVFFLYPLGCCKSSISAGRWCTSFFFFNNLFEFRSSFDQLRKLGDSNRDQCTPHIILQSPNLSGDSLFD
jgi:hypothetical protein